MKVFRRLFYSAYNMFIVIEDCVNSLTFKFVNVTKARL